MYTDSLETVVPLESAGKRLDAALRNLFPSLSLRAARRFMREYAITRNGLPVSGKAVLQTGDRIRLAPPKKTSIAGGRVIIVHNDLAALEKPAGLHSACLRGGAEAALEAALPRLLARYPGDWRLLNRLDKVTSGLVLAGASLETAHRFRQAENSGAIRKVYFAIVHGAFPSTAPHVLTCALDTAHTRRSKALDRIDPDPLRHTLLEPLYVIKPEFLALFTIQKIPAPLTLVRCTIHKGRRHQIRAHLAQAGYPIVGDPLYGDAPENARLFLHHAFVELPGFSAKCPIAWTENGG